MMKLLKCWKRLTKGVNAKKSREPLDFLADKYYNVFSGRQKKRGDKVSPRTGRPKSENPKNTRITVRLDKKHTEILEAY